MKRYCSGAAVWLQPVGAHLITSCRDGDGDLSGPRAAAHRRPTSAHAGVSGETCAVVTWKGLPSGWTRGQPAANQWGVLGRELGRSGYAGTAAPAWPGLPDRSEKLGKDVAPVGCRPTGLPAAAMTRQGRRARGSHRPWCCAVTLAAAQRHLRGFRSRDLNDSCRRRR